MKILHSTRILAGFEKNCIIAIMIVCIFCSSSCKKKAVIEEHPGFINSIYKRMDTAQNKYMDQAFYFIDSSFAALPNPGMGDIFVKDSIKLRKYYYIKHDYKKFLSLLDPLIELTKSRINEEKYAERYATTLYMKGGYYLLVKQYNESMHYVSMAEKVVLNNVKYKRNLANYSAVKAYLLFAQEKYLESAVSFKTQPLLALDNYIGDSCRGVIELQRNQNNVALCYLRAGLLDSASLYQNIALHTITSNENKYPNNYIELAYSKAVIYGDQAEVLELRGKYHEAEAMYKKSIGGTSGTDIGYTQLTQARLAEIYFKDKKIDSANLVLSELKLSLDTVANEKYLLKWYKLSAGYYSKTGQSARALQYMQQYETVRDSVEKRDQKFAVVDVSKEFENLELKYSNEVLQKEGNLKSLYLIIAIFTFVTIAAIAFFIWYNLKHTRRLHQQVAQKNEVLQIALTSLEQSHEENSRIIRIVAHDLKSPISAINNLIFSLLRKDYPGDLKEVFQLIKTACGSSMGLINDVLNQEKKPSVIRTELVDMKRLLEYCVDLLQAKADEKQQQLTLDADAALLMINRQKMWRVISNIVNNAIKFSPEHGVITIRLQKKENTVLLSVHDNGIGIPVNLKDKIFSMSPEASREGTSGEKSYGLGLSISQKIIEEHQGKIWFNSIEGEGAVFYVELPCMN